MPKLPESGQVWEMFDTRGCSLYLLLFLEVPCARLVLWATDGVSVATSQITHFEKNHVARYGSLLS